MRVAVCLVLPLLLAAPALAVDGTAVTTHRPGVGDWHGFRVNAFGKVVRHDIRGSRVVGSRVIYPSDSARCVVFDQSGTRLAFMKRNGRVHVMDTAGGNLRELASQNTRHTSWLDWPDGDWVYYSQESLSELCAEGWYKWTTCVDAMNLRRVNAVSGQDEFVAALGGRVWQLGMESAAQPGSGRLVISGPTLDSSVIAVRLFDLAAPTVQVRAYNGCGASMSPSGQYVTVNAVTHRDVMIWTWDGACAKTFHMNAWALPEGYDAREQNGYWTAHRWSCNSDRWVFLVQGRDNWGSTYGDAHLYNWQDQQQIRVTFNDPLGSTGSDDPEDFWVDRRPRFSVPLRTLLFTTQNEQRLPLTNGGESGTIPDAAVRPAQGTWLSVLVEGHGNAQTLVNTVNRTGLSSGEYYDTVWVSDPDSAVPSVWYTVRLTVGPYHATTIEVTPRDLWVTPGVSIPFSAVVRDQFGTPLSEPVLWRLPQGGGSVGSDGLFASSRLDLGRFLLEALCQSDTMVRCSTWVTVGDVPRDGLVLWLRADSGLTLDTGQVVSWQDLSDRHALALSDTGDPPVLRTGAVNGRPAVWFSGNAWLNLDTVRVDAFTIFAAYSLALRSQPFHFVLAGRRQGLSAGGTTPGYTEYGVWYGLPTALPGRWLEAPSTPGGFAVVTATNDTLRWNGLEPSHYSYRNRIDSLRLTRLAGRPDTVGQNLLGYVAEVLVYGRALSESELEGIERYLRAKYQPAPQEPWLRVLSPNGAERFLVGDTMVIRWEADTNRVTQVSLMLSPDNGNTWVCIPTTHGSIPTNSPEWGRLSFAVPSSLSDGTTVVPLACATCLLRVRSYLEPDVFDESDYPFTISERLVDARALRLAGTPAFRFSRTPDGLALAVTQHVPYRVTVFALNGRRLAELGGIGPALRSVALGHGVRVVNLAVAGRRTVQRVSIP